MRAAWLIVCAMTVFGAAAPAMAEPKLPSADALPTPRPAMKPAKRNAFPFRAWSYAKAYTYNFFDDRPVQMRVVKDGTWSPHIRKERLIGDAEAKRAAALVAETRGSIETTKCTFPRHAIVYFDNRDRPVASADVCFTCAAVLAAPDYSRPESFDYGAMADKLEGTVLAKWRKLFEGELGLPIDYRGADASSP